MEEIEEWSRVNEIVTVGLERIGRRRGEDLGVVEEKDYWEQKCIE